MFASRILSFPFPTDATDNCVEDDYPPSLVIPDRLTLLIPCNEQCSDYCIDKCFTRVDEAVEYLSQSLQVEYDCGHPEVLEVNVVDATEIESSDCQAKFEATPIHTCDATMVDSDPPNITCMFDNATMATLEDGMTILLEENKSESAVAIPSKLTAEVSKSWLHSKSHDITKSCIPF